MAQPRVSGSFDRATAEPVELAFGRDEYAARWAKAKAMMEADGIDVLYATSPAHMCWLHGYFAAWYRTHAPSNWGACLGTALARDWDEPIHFDAIGEDPLLYKTSVAQDMRFFDDRSPEGQPPFIVRELEKSGLIKPGTRIGLEKRSFQPNRLVSESIEAAFREAGCEVVDASMILRHARRVKSPAEIAHVEKAMDICALGHEAAWRTIKPGVTELDVQAEMAHAMHHAGGELSAIPIMIQSGNTIGGHQMPRRRVMQADEHVKIDASGVYFRYHGNLLRGYWVGEPPQSVRDWYKKSAGLVGRVFQGGTRGADQCARSTPNCGAIIRTSAWPARPAGVSATNSASPWRRTGSTSSTSPTTKTRLTTSCGRRASSATSRPCGTPV